MKLDTAVDQCETGDQWLTRRGELQALAMAIGYFPAAEQELATLDEAEFEDEAEVDHTNLLED